jgi:SAM-dependent methyltransferase
MTDWVTYLEGFHSRSPGLIESVLARCVAGDLTPYRWLTRAVSPGARLVLDVACGSGPVAKTLRARPGQRTPVIVGVDVSTAELHLAVATGATPVLRADAASLPFRPGCFDAVSCSMGLMVVSDLGAALGQICRVLRPGGVFVATVPSAVPLRRTDVRVLAPLTARLRSTPQFPAGGEMQGLVAALDDAGLRLLEDGRERFAFAVRDRADASSLVRSLYLPGTSDKRRESAVEWLVDRVRDGDPVEVAIPIRRVVALRG